MTPLNKDTLSLALMLRAANYRPTNAELRIGGEYADNVSRAESRILEKLYDHLGMIERLDTQLQIGTMWHWGSYYYYFCIARAQRRLMKV